MENWALVRPQKGHHLALVKKRIVTLPVVPTDPDEPERNSAPDCDPIETGRTITSVTANSIHLSGYLIAQCTFVPCCLLEGGAKSIWIFVFSLSACPLSWNTYHIRRQGAAQRTVLSLPIHTSQSPSHCTCAVRIKCWAPRRLQKDPCLTGGTAPPAFNKNDFQPVGSTGFGFVGAVVCLVEGKKKKETQACKDISHEHLLECSPSIDSIRCWSVERSCENYSIHLNNAPGSLLQEEKCLTPVL